MARTNVVQMDFYSKSKQIILMRFLDVKDNISAHCQRATAQFTRLPGLDYLKIILFIDFTPVASLRSSFAVESDFFQGILVLKKFLRDFNCISNRISLAVCVGYRTVRPSNIGAE